MKCCLEAYFIICIEIFENIIFQTVYIFLIIYNINEHLIINKYFCRIKFYIKHISTFFEYEFSDSLIAVILLTW